MKHNDGLARGRRSLLIGRGQSAAALADQLGRGNGWARACQSEKELAAWAKGELDGWAESLTSGRQSDGRSSGAPAGRSSARLGVKICKRAKTNARDTICLQADQGTWPDELGELDERAWR